MVPMKIGTFFCLETKVAAFQYAPGPFVTGKL